MAGPDAEYKRFADARSQTEHAALLQAPVPNYCLFGNRMATLFSLNLLTVPNVPKQNAYFLSVCFIRSISASVKLDHLLRRQMLWASVLQFAFEACEMGPSRSAIILTAGLSG